MMKRFIYLIYYFKQLDHALLKEFMRFVQEEEGLSAFYLWKDMIVSSFRYNISLLEYFQFRFWNKKSVEREEWAGTGFMYEYQLAMNPKSSRLILEDKIRFLQKYNTFVRRKWNTLSLVEQNPVALTELLTNTSGKIVLKNSKGQCGENIKVLNIHKLSEKEVIDLMKQNNLDLIEEFVVQHDDLMRLSPSGLNTVRIITQIIDDQVVLLAARLRISINSKVDNLAAGNLAAPIDIQTGVVCGKGVYSNITKKDEPVHPLTKVQIAGFQIPYWDKAIDLARQAALLHPQNRSIGWDIAITNVGVELIEGNHNWCKLLWQLPVHKGLKKTLRKNFHDKSPSFS